MLHQESISTAMGSWLLLSLGVQYKFSCYASTMFMLLNILNGLGRLLWIAPPVYSCRYYVDTHSYALFWLLLYGFLFLCYASVTSESGNSMKWKAGSEAVYELTSDNSRVLMMLSEEVAISLKFVINAFHYKCAYFVPQTLTEYICKN